MSKTEDAGLPRSLWVALAALFVIGSLAALAPRTHSVTTTFTDISPDNSGAYLGEPGIGVDPCPEPCASAHNGGRVNGISAVPGDGSTYFAASELAGIFKTTDGGQS